MKQDLVTAITAASYSGNKGAAAMLESSITQLYERYGERLNIRLMSVYPEADSEQIPFDFADIVSAKPEQLIFIAFPLAVLYKLFSWCPPVKAVLLKNRILKAYSGTDLVIDEAGISFVDDRGMVMNTYAFICAAVPMLLGVPVVKYSQAMGPFRNPWNRILAKIALSRMPLICARGKITEENLKQIGITKHVKLCADGAFTMTDRPDLLAEVDAECANDPFFKSNRIVAFSLSSVVDGKCSKNNIPYRQICVDFIDRINRDGYPVLIIANAARLGKTKPRNNDLMVCDAVYEAVADKSMVRWKHEEMTAEEIRAYIGKSRYLVASRFHAMIGALQQKVPVLLVGWSHKYQEVLDFFHLGNYSTDYSDLTSDKLYQSFTDFTAHEAEIRENLDTYYDRVMDSSRENIRLISEVLDGISGSSPKKGALLLYHDPSRYIGDYQSIRRGYAADSAIRANAASGGVITALLIHLLREGTIDGAWVAKSVFKDGKVIVQSFIATSEEELLGASSSVYMDFPMLKELHLVKEFNGKIAVVGIPCILHALSKKMDLDPELKEKIVLRLGLFCSGNPTPDATELALKKAHISRENAKRLYYRRGLWRGASSVVYEDGSEQKFSYKKTVCTYKNAYFFEKAGCVYCQDHFAHWCDISFGDIWLKEMKAESIKNTCVIIRSDRGKAAYQSAREAGMIIDRHLSGKDAVRGQKRALVYKYCLAQAKLDQLKKSGSAAHPSLDTRDKCCWNHRIAAALAEKNRLLSKEHPERLERIPTNLLYLYMCIIRALLSF